MSRSHRLDSDRQLSIGALSKKRIAPPIVLWMERKGGVKKAFLVAHLRKDVTASVRGTVICRKRFNSGVRCRFVFVTQAQKTLASTGQGLVNDGQ